MSVRCPVCRKPTDQGYQPFCSRRCADVDLARWLRADYALPGRDGEALGTGDSSSDDPLQH